MKYKVNTNFTYWVSVNDKHGKFKGFLMRDYPKINGKPNIHDIKHDFFKMSLKRRVTMYGRIASATGWR